VQPGNTNVNVHHFAPAGNNGWYGADRNSLIFSPNGRTPWERLLGPSFIPTPSDARGYFREIGSGTFGYSTGSGFAARSVAENWSTTNTAVKPVSSLGHISWASDGNILAIQGNRLISLDGGTTWGSANFFSGVNTASYSAFHYANGVWIAVVRGSTTSEYKIFRGTASTTHFEIPDFTDNTYVFTGETA
jgi:hypothetical protein